MGFGAGTAFDDGGTAFSEPSESATLAANVVKSESTRIVGVGFPDGLGDVPAASPFEAITDGAGSTDSTESSDVQAIDYYVVGSTSELSGVLTGIASEFGCALAVERLNDANDDSTFTDDETAPAPGDAVTYLVAVSNPGSIDSVTDDVYSSLTDGDLSPRLVGQTLPAGGSIVVTFEGVAPEENGVKTNTFGVTASDADGDQLFDNDPTTVRSPALNVRPRTPGFWQTHNGEYATGNNQDFTTDPLPISLGDDDAPVTVALCVDFSCPHCRRFHRLLFPAIRDELIVAGRVRYAHYDFPIPVHEQWSWAAAGAGRTGQADAGDAAFWQYVDLFAHERLLSFDVLARFADGASADGAVVRRAATANVYRELLERTRTEGIDRGVGGTPAVFVEDEAVVLSIAAIRDAVVRAGG